MTQARFAPQGPYPVPPLENGDGYRPVFDRLREFRGKYATWRTRSKLLEIDAERVIIRFELVDEAGRIRVTGHAEELRNSSEVNRTSAVANCETSAAGRALGFLGFHKNPGKDLQVVVLENKNYDPVAVRIDRFWQDNPDWSIVTELVKHGPGVFLFKAAILDAKDNLVAEGYAEGIRSADPYDINHAWALENAECSAIGRALAWAGYYGETFASAEEIRAARCNQNAAAPSEQPAASQSRQPQGTPRQKAHASAGATQPDPRPHTAPTSKPAVCCPDLEEHLMVVFAGLVNCEPTFLDLSGKWDALQNGSIRPVRKTPQGEKLHDFFLIDVDQAKDPQWKRILAFCWPESHHADKLRELGFDFDPDSGYWQKVFYFADYQENLINR